MKGNRRMPQCGFSAQVVQILDKLVPSYETVDVLRSPELRDEIKEFSQWQTIPQLYIDGQFIGGCDIVREMNASGELQKRIGAKRGLRTEDANHYDQRGGRQGVYGGRGRCGGRFAAPPDRRSVSAQAVLRAARHDPWMLPARSMGLDHDSPIAFHCYHGIRSQEAAQELLREGFRNVYNLKGGIDGWSLTIDLWVPKIDVH